MKFFELIKLVGLVAMLATFLPVDTDSSPERKLFGIDPISSGNGVTEYIVFYGPNARTPREADSTCRAFGGHLADVSSTSLAHHLGKCITSPSLIRSWEGNNYEGSPLALHPGGSITPVQCTKSAFICEVPIGTCEKPIVPSCDTTTSSGTCDSSTSYTCDTSSSSTYCPPTCDSSTYTCDTSSSSTYCPPTCDSSTYTCDTSSSSTCSSSDSSSNTCSSSDSSSNTCSSSDSSSSTCSSSDSSSSTCSSSDSSSTEYCFFDDQCCDRCYPRECSRKGPDALGFGGIGRSNFPGACFQGADRGCGQCPRRSGYKSSSVACHARDRCRRRPSRPCDDDACDCLPFSGCRRRPSRPCDDDACDCWPLSGCRDSCQSGFRPCNRRCDRRKPCCPSSTDSSSSSTSDSCSSSSSSSSSDCCCRYRNRDWCDPCAPPNPGYCCTPGNYFGGGPLGPFGCCKNEDALQPAREKVEPRFVAEEGENLPLEVFQEGDGIEGDDLPLEESQEEGDGIEGDDLPLEEPQEEGLDVDGDFDEK